MGARISVTATEVSLKKGKTITRSLFEFNKLRQVSMKDQGLTGIPEVIVEQMGYLPPIVDTLVELNLSRNHLASLPDEICLLVNLRRLHLNNNDLEYLPEQFCALCNLEKLYLNNNQLRELPIDISNIKRLKVLSLHCNNLSWIPSELGVLAHLKELTIHKNPLNDHLLSLNSLEDVMTFLLNSEDPPEYIKKVKYLEKQLNAKSYAYELKLPELRAFQRLIIDKNHSNMFFEFLEKEYATESLRFYVESRSFESRFDSHFPYTCSELVDAARSIYTEYIDDSVISEHKVLINIPNDIKKKIDAAFRSAKQGGLPRCVDQWVFEEANISILKLMYHDSFQRFIATPEGSRIWKKYDIAEIISNTKAKYRISKRLKALSTHKPSSHHNEKLGEKNDYYTFE